MKKGGEIISLITCLLFVINFEKCLAWCIDEKCKVFTILYTHNSISISWAQLLQNFYLVMFFFVAFSVAILPPKPGRIVKSWSSILRRCSDLSTEPLVMSELLCRMGLVTRIKSQIVRNEQFVKSIIAQTSWTNSRVSITLNSVSVC